MQYGAEPFEQQQFGTADVEGVKTDQQTSQVVIMQKGVRALSSPNPLTKGRAHGSRWGLCRQPPL